MRFLRSATEMVESPLNLFDPPLVFLVEAYIYTYTRTYAYTYIYIYIYIYMYM